MIGTSNVGGSVLWRKKIKIFDRISLANLKTIKYLHKTNHFKKSTTMKSTRKECGAIRKMVDIAKARWDTMEDLLAYDITSNRLLFGDDGFMRKSKKSELVQKTTQGPFFWEDGHHIPSRRYGPYKEGHLKRCIDFWRADWKDSEHYKWDFSSG